MGGIGLAPGEEQKLLSTLGINPDILQQPQQRVHTDLAARLFKQVQLELNDEFMGFTRSPCKVGIFSMICQLVSTTSNLGKLLEQGTHYYNLVTEDIHLAINALDDRAIFSLQLTEPALDRYFFLTEFLLVIWHRLSSWFIGEPIKLIATHFTFDKPEHFRELEIMFPGKLVFSQPENRLHFDSSYLQKTLVRSSEELASFIHNAPVDVMTIPGYEDSLEGQIERLIKARGQGLDFPGIHHLADELGLSSQTLHRRLQAGGSSYQKIKDNLRRATAVKLLADPDLSIEDISEKVGFAEARSFTRAFRHWTGISPRQYRKSLNQP